MPLRILSIALLTSLALPAFGHGIPAARQVDGARRTRPAPSDARRTPEVPRTEVALARAALAPGSIHGHVSFRPPPARRSARRYPGAGPTGASRVQDVAPIAYLRGTIGSARGGGAAVMAQRDTAFTPSALAVMVGAEVAFPNQDAFFHNVFSYSEAQRFDLGRYPRGESKSVRFERPGVVRIYCEVHETMRAAILVTENPYHAVVAEDGTFVLDGVPPGQYVVEVWHPDLGTAEAPVVVRSGGVASVEMSLG